MSTMPPAKPGRATPASRLRELEAIVNSIVDYGIITVDLDGRVASWSRGAEALKQYTADEIIGRPVSVFYTEEDKASGLIERELAGARDYGRFENEGWRIRKDGSRFWANVVFAPIRDAHGDLAGYVKVTRDLTERREQEELLRRQRDEILELSTPVIQVWDRVLALPIIGTLDSVRAARLTEGLLEKIAEYQSEVVILDISGVPVVDTQVAQHLLRTVQAATLMGAASVLCGVRPETAQAIVRLGIDMGQLRSRTTLRDALQLAMQLTRDRAAAAAAGDPAAGRGTA